MQHAVDSRYAWGRLVVAVLLMTIGSGSMYVVAVVLPSVQAEFGTARDASLPYMLLMIGFGIGGSSWAPGRPARRRRAAPDRRRRARRRLRRCRPGANIWTFAIVHGVLLGLVGSSASFAPLVADTSLWFERRRGIAVAICASGNYVAGAIWPRSSSTSSRASAGARPTSASASSRRCRWRRWRSSCAVVRRRSRRPPTPAARARRRRRGRSACRRARRRRCLHRRRCLLRRDVDAAGPHRRLLRRPRYGAAAARRCCR
jgi:hypothetical protein